MLLSTDERTLKARICPVSSTVAESEALLRQLSSNARFKGEDLLRLRNSRAPSRYGWRVVRLEETQDPNILSTSTSWWLKLRKAASRTPASWLLNLRGAAVSKEDQDLPDRYSNPWATTRPIGETEMEEHRSEYELPRCRRELKAIRLRDVAGVQGPGKEDHEQPDQTAQVDSVSVKQALNLMRDFLGTFVDDNKEVQGDAK